ncbi:sulfotransferase family 2 domain-containing protein [Paraglaciecola marina]|uniref:sulfotransferase family 2 domain-containing protein n=1 Tax=Paraglaciecola marina TaxID=2500157 RepID=UPI00106000A1|nr:sulfotransferase family 2 domain-containing protein [Paraglaciecola marina]
MLISENKKFLYYHLYKVAGTSIRKALRPHCSILQVTAQNLNYATSIIIKKNIFQSPLCQFHPRLADVKLVLGNEFYSYYRFTFVRAPLDWQKSLYFFALKNPRHHQHSIISCMSFDEYIVWRIDNDLKLQTDLIMDGKELLVNNVYKFENIDSEFRKLCEKLNISANLQHKNVAGTGKKINITSQTLKRFHDAYARDYEVLGYSFDDN